MGARRGNRRVFTPTGRPGVANSPARGGRPRPAANPGATVYAPKQTIEQKVYHLFEIASNYFSNEDYDTVIFVFFLSKRLKFKFSEGKGVNCLDELKDFLQKHEAVKLVWDHRYQNIISEVSDDQLLSLFYDVAAVHASPSANAVIQEAIQLFINSYRGKQLPYSENELLNFYAINSRLQRQEPNKGQSLEEVKEELRKELLTNVSNLKHSVNQYLSSIRSNYTRTVKYLNRLDGQTISLDKPIRENEDRSFKEHLEVPLKHLEDIQDYLLQSLSYSEKPKQAKPILSLLDETLRQFSFSECFELNLRVDPSLPPQTKVKVRELNFRILFQNILDNAKKHGFENKIDPRNKVRVEVSYLKDSKHVFLKISNNGLVPKNIVDPKHFFERGHSTAKGRSFGIGTDHIRQIVEGVQGEVSLEINSKQEFGFAYLIKIPISV